MAAHQGSAYNLHNRHKENHTKIGNWVEERALISMAPEMCIPPWGDVDADGKRIQWTLKSEKPDAHKTMLLTGAYENVVAPSTSTGEAYKERRPHKEPSVGVRDQLVIDALMAEASKAPPAAPDRMQFETESSRYSQTITPKPITAEGAENAKLGPITLWSHGPAAVNSKDANGNFWRKNEFSTPIELRQT